MANYAAMNKACKYSQSFEELIIQQHASPDRLTITTDVEIVSDPKPCRTCVCVKELPFKTDVSTNHHKDVELGLTFRFQVEIECIAHQ
jgi:hypothetical protein